MAWAKDKGKNYCETVQTETNLAETAAATVKEMGELTGHTEETENIEKTAELLEANATLNFVLVENTYLETPSEQNIVVGFNEKNLIIESASLLYQKAGSEAVKSWEMTQSVDNLVHFQFSFNNKEDSGIYNLLGIKIDVQGTESVIYFSDEGLSAGFGINEQYENKLPAIGIREESGEEVNASIITLSGDEPEIDEASVKAAMESQDDELGVASLDGIISTMDANNNLVVVLDAGHCSRHDNPLFRFSDGTYANKTEGQMNYQIMLACKAELEKQTGITVYTTRPNYDCIYPSSKTICLTKRIEYAKSVGADALISFHNNASGASVNNTARGTEVIVAVNGTYRNQLAQHTQELGKQVANELAKLGLSIRYASTDGLLFRTYDGYSYEDGSVADYYAIVRESRKAGFPGIIIEHAFFDNKADYEEFLSTDEKLNALGVADAKAIISYFLDEDGEYQTNLKKIEDFVKRYYHSIMGREPEVEGLKHWSAKLQNGVSTGADIAEFFLYSDEFLAKNVSDKEFIDIMYYTFFGRDPDPTGYRFWMDYLTKGVTRKWVTNWFISSLEFTEICNDYGIEKGEMPNLQPKDQNAKLTMYIFRCYKKILERNPEIDGLNFWAEAILNGSSDASEVAEAFVFSDEFIEKQLSDEEYIRVLYRSFMGREGDSQGVDFWLGRMTAGWRRREVFNYFAGSPEFQEILAEFF